MSDAATPPLNDCGCCEGVEDETPVLIENPPGLAALAYRVGTHSRFKQSMQVDLTRDASLRDLKTRRDDDPTIGLLDAWATVLDVLTFYQERIANEGYLRTGTERRSLLERRRRLDGSGRWSGSGLGRCGGRGRRRGGARAGQHGQGRKDEGDSCQERYDEPSTTSVPGHDHSSCSRARGGRTSPRLPDFTARLLPVNRL